MIIYVSSQNRFQQRFAALKELVKVLKIFLPVQGSQVVFGGGAAGGGPHGFDPGQSSTASSCGVPPQREQLAAVPVPDTVILARGRSALGFVWYQCLGAKGGLLVDE